MKNNIKKIVKDFADLFSYFGGFLKNQILFSLFDVDVDVDVEFDICLGRMFSGLDYIQPNNRGKKKK